MRSQKFRKAVLAWHKAHAPPMPWRKTRDPWHILVSEIMLQQTQISRVQELYPAFIRRFPTPRHMARAQLKTVLSAWHLQTVCRDKYPPRNHPRIFSEQNACG